MKNKIIIFALLASVSIPQIASASWWNPFSWKIFSRISSPKVETVQEVVQTEEIATTTNETSEVEKLKAEIEELKSQKNNNSSQKVAPTTQTSTKQKTPTVTSAPTSVTTKIIGKDEMFADLIQRYTNFQSTVTNERNGLKRNSPYASEKQYFTYIDSLLNSITSDLGYLISIKDWKQRPAIEETYLSKFNKLKSEYEIEDKRYETEREKDKISSLTAQEQAEKDAATQSILDQQKYVQDIKVKIAEMDQLRIQIDTLAWSSLVDILNGAKKLKGEPLFYTLEYQSAYSTYTLYYPYSKNLFGSGNLPSDIEHGLQAIVSNYRAYLNVELAKNQ